MNIPIGKEDFVDKKKKKREVGIIAVSHCN